MRLADFIQPSRFAVLAEEADEDAPEPQAAPAAAGSASAQPTPGAAARATAAAYSEAAPPGTTAYAKEADDPTGFTPVAPRRRAAARAPAQRAAGAKGGLWHRGLATVHANAIA